MNLIQYYIYYLIIYFIGKLFCNLYLILMIINASKVARSLLTSNKFFVADYKQVYDGIINF